MEQSFSWEVNTISASQEIPHLLFNPKVHYCVHNSPTLVTVVSQTNPAHTFPPYFLKIQSNIIFLSTSIYTDWSLHLRLSEQNLACISYVSHACYIHNPSHSPCVHHPLNICLKQLRGRNGNNCMYSIMNIVYHKQEQVTVFWGYPWQ